MIRSARIAPVVLLLGTPLVAPADPLQIGFKPYQAGDPRGNDSWCGSAAVAWPFGFSASDFRVLIYGADAADELMLRELRNNPSLRRPPVGFLDDDRSKLGMRMHERPGLGASFTRRYDSK